jgi:hypothetical protein
MIVWNAGILVLTSGRWSVSGGERVDSERGARGALAAAGFAAGDQGRMTIVRVIAMKMIVASGLLQ